jgi:hypothetical protein
MRRYRLGLDEYAFDAGIQRLDLAVQARNGALERL